MTGACDMRDGTGACLCGTPQPDCLWYYPAKPAQEPAEAEDPTDDQ